MAFAELNLTLFCLLFVPICIDRVAGMSGWAGCLDGNDVYAAIKENSLSGEVVAELMADTTMEGIRWSVAGKDAEWFFLDERNIRLNASADKILDREALGPVLMAELSCHEEGILQSVYRLMVEILNENDNPPVFTKNYSRARIISELIPVNTVVFTVQATDADNDKILYSIDQTSPDAEYFKVNLPNSGEVILSKPLDYETKPLLNVTIYASEMNTAEHYNTSTNIVIAILDGDDQYPQFLPCKVLFQDETSRICTSPVYMVNVTEGEKDIVLDFSPGPIQAVDGDRGINSSVSYAILSGDDGGHFRMDKETGEMRLIGGVIDRLLTPVLTLQVMAFQANDPSKYSVATVLVRVLAVNLFCPEFDTAEYHGFVTAGRSPVSLVYTYGNKALMLQVHDQDFNQGFNPMIYFTFTSTSNHTDIYQVTHGGLLIAKSSRITAKDKHILEVMAVDQESGDTTFATVVVEVLTEGQSIPYSLLGGDRLTGCTVGKALFLSMVIMTLLGCILSILMWLKRKHKGMRDPLERGCVAQGKHPNVSLRWFQLVNHQNAMTQMEELSYNSEEYGTCNPSFSFSGKPVIYTKQDIHISQEPAPLRPVPSFDNSFNPTETACSTMTLNKNAVEPTKTTSSLTTFLPTRDKISPAHVDQAAASSSENPDLLPDVTSDSMDAQSNNIPGLDTNNDTRPSSFTVLHSQATTNDNIDAEVTSPSLPSTSPYSHIEMASAEMDKHLLKTSEMTPPLLPVQSSHISKETGTPPPTPEHGLLKATLVHIDTSPTDTPPETPGQAAGSLSAEANQPCTSLDQLDPPEPTGGTADPKSPSQGRRLSTNSGNTQGDPEVGNKDDDGFLGDEDADKNSEDDDELESDEEELLRIMARCNPIFITFSK